MKVDEWKLELNQLQMVTIEMGWEKEDWKLKLIGWRWKDEWEMM